MLSTRKTHYFDWAMFHIVMLNYQMVIANCPKRQPPTPKNGEMGGCRDSPHGSPQLPAFPAFQPSKWHDKEILKAERKKICTCFWQIIKSTWPTPTLNLHAEGWAPHGPRTSRREFPEAPCTNQFRKRSPTVSKQNVKGVPTLWLSIAGEESAALRYKAGSHFEAATKHLSSSPCLRISKIVPYFVKSPFILSCTRRIFIGAGGAKARNSYSPPKFPDSKPRWDGSGRHQNQVTVARI